VIAVTTCRNLLSAALLASLLLAVSPPAAGEPHPWIAAQPDAPADPKALPYYLARPIRQGSEVEFLGEIDFGAAEELRRALALAPSAKVLHLNSPGGEIQEAREMAQIVHERGIITTVDKLCMSACPLVFLAGKQRYVAPGAEMGFHRFESPGMSTAEMDTLNQVDRNYMQKAGIPREFIDKAFATPISSIWIPTHAELQTAGIITGVTSKYLIAVGAYRSYLGERAEAIELILDTIKRRYPERYPTVHARLYQALKSGSNEVGVAAGENSTLGDFLMKFMAHSGDQMATDFLRAFVGMLANLARRDPDVCFYTLFRSKAPPGFSSVRYLQPGEAEQVTLVMLKAAADGAQRNAPLPSAREAAVSWRLLEEKMKVWHPGDIPILADIDSPAHDHAAVCKARVDFFSMILTLPRADQATVARYIYSGGLQDDGLGDGASTTATRTELPRQFGIHPDK